jgi:glycosyltransferase involved in cell wall biosynthesis
LMTSWPRISIVTPSFRGASLIEATLQSVLSQGYPNLEYIVIDGAGDDTASILRRHDGQLAYWCSEPDSGQYDAINKGFARATGDILFWLNSDDMLLPRSLFVVGEIFNGFPEIEWLSTLSPGVWDANGYLCRINSVPGFSRDAFLDGYFLPGTRAIQH